jgi:hypothetical protein
MKQFNFHSVECRISAWYFGKNGAGRDGAEIYALSCPCVGVCEENYRIHQNCLSAETDLKSEPSADVAGGGNFSIVRVGKTQKI